MAEQTDDTSGKLRQFKQWFKADKAHCEKFHKAAKEDFEFLAGEQWTDQEKQKLKAELRPIITFNRTNPIIQSVSGMEISNRKEVKYFPREQGDAKANELLTEGAKWFRDLADADDEDSDAFLDSCVCGLGVTETTLDYEEEENGQPMMGSVNPLEVLWDKGARKKNFTDRRRQWRVRKLPLSLAMEMFEGETRQTLDAKWAELDTDKSDEESQEEADLYEGDTDAHENDEQDVTIVHLQYKKTVPVRIVVDMLTGRQAEVPADKLDTLLKRAEKAGQFYTVAGKKTVTKIMNVFIGSKILGKETEALCEKHFSFQFITAYIDRNTGLPYGLMKMMKDPQRWANKWMSQALHILNTNAKGGLLYEESAITDPREFERNWARPDKNVKVADGALSQKRIQEKQQTNMPAGFFQMMEFAISSVRDVTGISLELMGNRETTQAASLEYQRRQAGMTLLAPLFDNLKRYRRDHGKLMLYIIQNYLADGRLVRIVGEQGAQYVPLALEADVQYDIIVDDQVNSPDQKLMVWQSLMPILPTLPPQIQLALVDYAPLPTAVIEKIKEAASQMGPSEEQQKIAQLQIEGAVAEIEKTKSETAENVAQAQKIQSESGGEDNTAEIMRVHQDGQIKAAGMAQDAQLSREKQATDAQLNREKMSQDAALAIVKAGIEAKTRENIAKSQPKERANG